MDLLGLFDFVFAVHLRFFLFHLPQVRIDSTFRNKIVNFSGPKRKQEVRRKYCLVLLNP